MRLTVDELKEMFAPHLPFTLHPWQWEDIETLSLCERAGVFLPVGAGKTVIATMVALAWGDPKVIVLLPPILIKQWVKWLNSIPGSGGAVAFEGPPKKRHEIDIDKYRFLVMSMGIFKNDFKLLTQYYKGEPVTLVVDEAQAIKNSETDSAQKVYLFSMGRKIMLLTGTELNSPGDAYGYIKIKTPLVYRSFHHFKNLHVAEEDFWGEPVKWKGIDILKSNLYAQSVKRSKEEVHAHLPKANYIPIEYDLKPEHLKLYNQLADEMLLEMPSGGKIDATQASSLYNALQQIVLGWPYFADDPKLRPAAFDLLDLCFDEIALGKPGSSKFIIWTWFKRSTKAVLDYGNSLYPNAFVAAYSEANSRKSVDRFLEDPSCFGLVAQPGSAGAGLNPQGICWEMLFLEAPTRTIPFRQAAGRVDREGQKYNANIRVAMASGTIQVSMFRKLLTNDAQVMAIQNETDLRAAIYGK